jgi:hypothetical protein
VIVFGATESCIITICRLTAQTSQRAPHLCLLFVSSCLVYRPGLCQTHCTLKKALISCLLDCYDSLLRTLSFRYAELPLLIRVLPEKDALATWIGFALQIGNVGPFAYVIYAAIRRRRVQVLDVCALTSIAPTTDLFWLILGSFFLLALQHSNNGRHWPVLALIVTGLVAAIGLVVCWQRGSDGVHAWWFLGLTLLSVRIDGLPSVRGLD